MYQLAKRIFIAAAPLLLTGCLWGPGKFTSDLTLKKDGSFVLDYKGEIVLQTPPEANKPQPWSKDNVRCRESGSVEIGPFAPEIEAIDGKEIPKDPIRPCKPAEIEKGRVDHEEREAERAKTKREEAEQMARMFGLPGFDEESNRAFAAKLSKYAGYRSVQYRGKGVFDVDYHFEGRATQDFVFPAMPDNDFLIPFVAIRRRADGSVLVTAPAFTGGVGPLGARAGAPAAGAMKDGPVSRAQGRFTIITNGEVLTNNSEDGASPHPTGRQIRWDVGAGSSKIPEALVRLQ
jgi:hypothetical protein